MRFDGRGLYNEHSSRVDADGDLRWIAASGCRGISRLEIDVAGESEPPTEAKFTVRLIFCDPDFGEAGKRQFDVLVQSQPAFTKLDVAAEAGGRRQPLIKELSGVAATDALVVEFVAGEGDAGQPTPILSGIEVLRER